MSDIFISYAREDQQRAEMLAQLLGGRGWSIFWDRTIPTGKTWRETVGSELDDACCVIVLWSKTSIESGWVQEEADEAKRRGVLVPILIENVQPPMGFRSIQAAHLENWGGTESTQAFSRLIVDIAALIGLPPKEAEGRQVQAEIKRKAEEERKLAQSQAKVETAVRRKVDEEAKARRRAEDRPYLRRAAVAGVAVAVLLLVGWIGLISTNTLMWPPWAETRVGIDTETQADVAEQERQARAAAEAEAEEAKRKADEAERQAEQERQARAAAEQAAQQQLIALKAEADRKQAQSAAEARYSTLMNQANTDSNTGNFDNAIATFGEAIRLNPNDALAFYSRGLAYGKKGDNEHAIADYNEAIRLDAKNALAFRNRGLAYEKKGNNDQAIADFSDAIRLDPNDAVAFNSRGVVYGMKGDYDRAIADFNKGILLDPTRAVAFGNRGLAFVKKGDNNQAIADFDAAIRLNPYDARAFCNRGITKSKIKDKSGDADIAKARQLDAEVCR
jgi:tetratricopeptide (TPR) repeat protein